MDTSTFLLLLAAAMIGALVAGLVVRATARAQAAAVYAERNVLRVRVRALESGVEADHELRSVLAPLATGLERVQSQVHTLERDRVQQQAELASQITSLAADGQQLRAHTAALAGALRASSTRGTWGEVQLRRVVEHAGMLERVDFDTQARSDRVNEPGVRPDLVVNLPGGKHVVVDAKAPMAAALAAGDNTATNTEALGAWRAHAKALRAHVDTLATKSYWSAFAPAPEFVVCFVPSEALLGAALEADAGLLDYAMGRQVVLASPATLLALLRTVAYSWHSDALVGNARALFDVGRELYTRLGTLGTGVGKLGRTLARATEDYNALVGTLERRVLVTARRMHDLDLTDAELPEPATVSSAPRPVTADELLNGAPSDRVAVALSADAQ